MRGRSSRSSRIPRNLLVYGNAGWVNTPAGARTEAQISGATQSEIHRI